MSIGKIYMIPVPISDSDTSAVIPDKVLKITLKLKYFIVENVRTARRYLKQVDPSVDIDRITFFVLNKHTKDSELMGFLQPALDGNDIGIMSESGCPGIADPGSAVTRLAHMKNIKIIPLVGPSSIFLSLSASGLNGQNFVFHGYLPVKSPERIKKLRLIETQSKKENQTQIFIETPYRNNSLLQDILKSCNPATRLCIAANISGSDEFIVTAEISKWKKKLPDLNKKTTIFLILA